MTRVSHLPDARSLILADGFPLILTDASTPILLSLTDGFQPQKPAIDLDRQAEIFLLILTDAFYVLYLAILPRLRSANRHSDFMEDFFMRIVMYFPFGPSRATTGTPSPGPFTHLSFSSCQVCFTPLGLPNERKMLPTPFPTLS